MQIAMIAAFIALAPAAFATPSTQIWIPSTDTQGFGVVHFGADVYSTPSRKSAANGGDGYNVVNYGLTVGVLPPSVTDKLGFEIGLDYRDISGDSENPTYWNAKFGLVEGDIMPAFAVGMFDLGGKNNVNDYNIMYGLVAKSFDGFGRLGIGAYSGNDKLLLDENGQKDATGLLASWDKTLNEKFWAAVDYMGGKNGYGALSFGVSYAVSPTSSVIFGYDIYNNSNIKPSFTFQYDVNF